MVFPIGQLMDEQKGYGWLIAFLHYGKFVRGGAGFRKIC